MKQSDRDEAGLHGPGMPGSAECTSGGSDTGMARASTATTAPGAASVMCTSTVADSLPIRSSSTSTLGATYSTLCAKDSTADYIMQNVDDARKSNCTPKNLYTPKSTAGRGGQS